VEIFGGWKRPDAALKFSSSDDPSDHVLDDLLMASGRHDIDLVQDITTDCSVVASLCAGTARGLKGHGMVSVVKLISDLFVLILLATFVNILSL
jgi:calpain-7